MTVQTKGRDNDYKGVFRFRTLEREAKNNQWQIINIATDDPKLEATKKVQRKVGGDIEHVHNKEDMEGEIQSVTKKRFDLAHSKPISLASLFKKKWTSIRHRVCGRATKQEGRGTS